MTRFRASHASHARRFVVAVALALPLAAFAEDAPLSDELALQREQAQARHWLSLKQRDYIERDPAAGSPAGRFALDAPLESQRREQAVLHDRQVRELRAAPGPAVIDPAMAPSNTQGIKQRQGLEQRMLNLQQDGQRRGWEAMRPPPSGIVDP